MTLADNVLLSTRTLTYFVRIYTTTPSASPPVNVGGPNVLLLPDNPTSATGTPGVSGIRISKSFDSPVPVCQIDLNRVPSWITRGMGITVDVGYNGLTQRLFTGFVQSRERGIGKGSLNCMGRLWTAFRTVQISSRSVDGVTVSSAIGTILDSVGITDNRSITVPAFTLGTASSPTLEGMPASQMLQQLMDIDGGRIYELGSGQVVVRVIDEAPAPTSFKTYTSSSNANARILEASDREDPEYYRNRVIVTGATVTEGSAPDETSRTITATATNVGSALVQPALPSGTYVDAEYQNHLIDTDAKAASVAIRLLGKFARIPRQLQLEIAGDPELELGQTLTFTMPELDLNDRGFISGIEHIIDESGYVTRLTDFRGAGDTGGTLAQNPIAAFTFKSEVEVYGAQTNVVATFDASGSFDPDGTIASYAWSDNQTTTPEIATFTTKFPRVRADTSAWTGSWSVTLTVTDNSGLTGSTTITIPYKNTDTEIIIPAVYAAITNRHSASLDGAVNWNDQTVGSGNSVSVGARPADGVNVGHACFGTSTGRIYRTTDGCATAPTLVYTSAAGVSINDIQWDWRNGLVVWAIDENCILYVSLDAGVTWGIYGGAGLRTTLGLSGALGNQIGLPAGGGVYIFGGNGTGTPLIAYDAGLTNNWVQVIMTGDAVTDFPADATMRIVDYTAGFTQECMILSWSSGGGGSITAVYTTPSGGATSRAFTRASTTFGGLKTGRYIVSDNVLILSNSFYCAFANRSIWASTDGVAWTETTNVMPAAVTPSDIVGMTGSTELTGIVGMFGVFMIAASDGLYKWTAGEATASYMRGGTGAGAPAWPASAAGKKLSIGAPGAAVTSSGALAVMDTNNDIQTWNGSSTWTTKATAAGTDGKSLMRLANGHWLFLDNWGNSGDIYHSADGITFAVTLAHTANRGVFGFDISADGTIWAVMGNNATATGTNATKGLLVYKSTDNGATFTLAYTDAGYSTSFNTRPLLTAPSAIVCDKWNANNVFINCAGTGASEPAALYNNSAATSSTFTQRTSPAVAPPHAGTTNQEFMVFGNNGRVIYQVDRGLGHTVEFWYTDDYANNWTLSVDTGYQTPFGLGWYRPAWFNRHLALIRVTTVPNTMRLYISSDNGLTWADSGLGGIADSDWDAVEYDYSTDTAYIAVSLSATVYKVTGVFSGSPVKSTITGNRSGLVADFNTLALPR